VIIAKIRKEKVVFSHIFEVPSFTIIYFIGPSLNVLKVKHNLNIIYVYMKVNKIEFFGIQVAFIIRFLSFWIIILGKSGRCLDKFDCINFELSKNRKTT